MKSLQKCSINLNTEISLLAGFLLCTLETRRLADSFFLVYRHNDASRVLTLTSVCLKLIWVQTAVSMCQNDPTMRLPNARTDVSGGDVITIQRSNDATHTENCGGCHRRFSQAYTYTYTCVTMYIISVHIYVCIYRNIKIYIHKYIKKSNSMYM